MMPTPAHARRLIVLVAVAGFILRAAFGLLYWTGKPLTHDEREYLALARSVAAGQGFIYDEDHDTGTAQQFGRAPAYPLFLVAIGAGGGVHDASPARVKVAQALLGAGAVWLIGLIALRAAGPRAGVAAAAIAAAYPPLVWIGAYVFSEALYTLLALATVLLLDRAIDRVDEARSARAGGALVLVAGLLAGVAVLTRPAMLFFLPLVVLWLGWRRLTVLALAFVVAVLAVVAPWTARNYRVYDRFVLVASEGGVTFWTGNHPLAIGEGDLAANPDLKRAEIAFRAARPGLTAEELEPHYYREALGYIAERPGWWLGLLARKAFYTVVPIGPSYLLHSTRYRVATWIPYALVLLFAIAGWTAIWRSPRRPVALLLLAASALLVSLVFFPQERFRIPVLDPTLIVCAAAAAARLRQPA
jgi:4-amino-4-deoxy-L-arabinose transferase-like glycosyltransferase